MNNSISWNVDSKTLQTAESESETKGSEAVESETGAVEYSDPEHAMSVRMVVASCLDIPLPWMMVRAESLASASNDAFASKLPSSTHASNTPSNDSACCTFTSTSFDHLKLKWLWLANVMLHDDDLDVRHAACLSLNQAFAILDMVKDTHGTLEDYWDSPHLPVMQANLIKRIFSEIFAIAGWQVFSYSAYDKELSAWLAQDDSCSIVSQSKQQQQQLFESEPANLFRHYVDECVMVLRQLRGPSFDSCCFGQIPLASLLRRMLQELHLASAFQVEEKNI